LVHLSEILPEVLESLGAAAYTDDPRPTNAPAQPDREGLAYAYLLGELDGLPPDAPSVEWVFGLDPELPVSEDDSILISARARIDRRRSFEHQSFHTPLAEVLPDVLESLGELAEADAESAGGLHGPVSEGQRHASKMIDLAYDTLDRLVVAQVPGR